MYFKLSLTTALTFLATFDIMRLLVSSAFVSLYYRFLSSLSRTFCYLGSSLKIFFPAGTPLAESDIFLEFSPR